MSGEDAIEMMMAGASAVQVGTATFVNPRAPLDVLEGIEQYVRDNGVDDVGRIVGAAHPEPRRAEARSAERVTAQRIHPE